MATCYRPSFLGLRRPQRLFSCCRFHGLCWAALEMRMIQPSKTMQNLQRPREWRQIDCKSFPSFSLSRQLEIIEHQSKRNPIFESNPLEPMRTYCCWFNSGPNRPAMNKRGSSRETAGVLFGFQNSAIVFPRSWTNHQKLIVFPRPNRHKRLCQRKWKIQQLKAGQSSGIMTKIQNSIITSWGHFMKTSRDI